MTLCDFFCVYFTQNVNTRLSLAHFRAAFSGNCCQLSAFVSSETRLLQNKQKMRQVSRKTKHRKLLQLRHPWMWSLWGSSQYLRRKYMFLWHWLECTHPGVKNLWPTYLQMLIFYTYETNSLFVAGSQCSAAKDNWRQAEAWLMSLVQSRWWAQNKRQQTNKQKKPITKRKKANNKQ